MLGYESTANVLRDRITALIPAHPEILNMDSAFELFRIPCFNCDDLEPSIPQARWALNAAKQEWREGASV